MPLPEPPAPGQLDAPAAHLRGHHGRRDRGRNRARQGHRRRVRRASARPWGSCRATRGTVWPAWPRSKRWAGAPPMPAPTSATPRRWRRPSTRSKAPWARSRVLVNNAAANFPVPAEDLSPNGWRAVTQIVLDGTFFCSQELFRRATGAGEPAAICNILATQSFTGGPGMAHTSAAKAGVGNLTKTLAVEWAPSRDQGERAGAGAVPPRGHAGRPPGAAHRGRGRRRPALARRGAWGGSTSWAGPPPGCARPTPPSSPATPWWSTGPTGCGGTSSCPSSSRSGTRSPPSCPSAGPRSGRSRRGPPRAARRGRSPGGPPVG